MAASIIQTPDSTSHSNSETTGEIRDAIRAFVLETFPTCRRQGLKDTDSLIDSGIVDSMGILELVAFAESDFGILIEDTDLTPENFESIAALTGFVISKH